MLYSRKGMGPRHASAPQLWTHTRFKRRWRRTFCRSRDTVRTFFPLVWNRKPVHQSPRPRSVVAANGYPPDALPFSSLILIDPGIFSPDSIAKVKKTDGPLLQILEYTAKLKRDRWDSRQAARTWMAKRLPWNHWDPKVLDLFIVRAPLP